MAEANLIQSLMKAGKEMKFNGYVNNFRTNYFNVCSILFFANSSAAEETEKLLHKCKMN